MNLENFYRQKMSEATSEGCSIIDCDITDFLPEDPFAFDISSSETSVDCLPMDPFGMEFVPSGMVINCLPADPVDTDKKSRASAIKDWLQEFDEDFNSNFSKYGVDEAEKDSVRDGLLAGLDSFFNSAMKLESEKGNLSLDAMFIKNDRVDRFLDDHRLTNVNVDCEDNIGNLVVGDMVKELQEQEGDPHDGLFYVLSYVGLDDLLAIERVCKSLRDAVRGDSLLWRSIHIDHPLNLKLTDEALVKLTSRARGTLQCLSLVQCIRVTDNGLKQVLDGNPSLIKLGVSGCVRLNVDVILSTMRILKSSGSLKIKQLRFGGLFSVTKEQYEELKSILDVDDDRQLKGSYPRYYHAGQLYVSLGDSRALDIEICPKCQKVRLVYDCSAKSCQGEDTARDPCRACAQCISRCIYCGHCVKDPNYEETFCLDFLCLVCLKRLLSCEEKPEVMNSS